MSEFELIPYTVVESLINKLTSLSSADFGRNNGVTEELKFLETSFESIKGVLSDVKGNEEGEQTLQDWIRRLKDVLHAADDLLDDIATDYLVHVDKVRSFFSPSNVASRLRIAREIKKIQKDVHDVVDSKNLDTIRLNLSKPREKGERETTSLLEKNVIDIGSQDSEKKKIISHLMQSPGNELVIGLVGMGGMGKTVIAQMVYNDEKVIQSFDIRMWVYVSQNFDFKTIVRNILESLTGEKSSGQEPFKEVRNKVCKELDGKSYFLVLDDIWNESPKKWMELRSCLMCGAQGSKILVTTRSENVARVMEAKDRSVFHLTVLSEEESWSLFRKFAFSDDDYVKDHALKPIARKITKKCGGVPLAIKTVADVLRGEYSKWEWIAVLERDFWKQGKENDAGILSILKLSYQQLSPRAKQCFAYCSVYPKGWEIEKNELIQLWMAEDYLQCSNDRQQMEDVGNEIVQTLLTRSFFRDAKFDEYGNLVSFQMHALIHDLALSIAGKDYFLTEKIDPESEQIKHISISLDSKTIRFLNPSNASRLRTFFLQRPNDWEIGQMTRELFLILRFRCLRVLNLSHSSLNMLPSLIGKLKHLRYLDLSWCVKLASLPKSIGRLVNLQTLKLTGCETLEFSTEVVTKLISLKHLEIHRCKAFEDKMPTGLGKLSSLQSLSSFYVVDDKKNAGKLNELQDLNNLGGNLQISRLDRVRDVTKESQYVNLKDKKSLESLDLTWENQKKTGDSLQLLENLRPDHNLKRLTVGWYPGERFSNWLSSISKLSYVSFFGFNNCKYLPPLEDLPHLRSLEIGSMKALEYICFKVVSPTGATFFQSLERLKFSGCEKLQGWKRMEDDASPDHLSLPPLHRLTQLVINKCPMLTCFPTFPNVEELQLCESMMKPLKQKKLDTGSSSSTSPLSRLKSLKVEGKLLDIRGLPSHWTQNLTSLEYLEIRDVEDLEMWFVNGFPSSLRKIVVYDCDSHALPDRMCDLLSLQHIKLLGCQNLALLPEGMPRLSNLVTLEILDCPLLVERCQRKTGVDWPKIFHVANIILKQNEKRY